MKPSLDAVSPYAGLEAMSVDQQELSALRQQIDQIDRDILSILKQRAVHGMAITRCNENGGLPEFAPEREISILKNLMAMNRGPIPNATIKPIFAEIISACRAVQQPLKVAFLGPEATLHPPGGTAPLRLLLRLRTPGQHHRRLRRGGARTFPGGRGAGGEL